MQRNLSPVRRQLLYLVLLMVGLAVAVGGTSVWFLYETAFREERARLVELAQSQARLIESVARYDQVNSTLSTPAEIAAATLSQITDAHNSHEGFGITGEFTLARRDGNHIEFLLSHRNFDLDKP